MFKSARKIYIERKKQHDYCNLCDMSDKFIRLVLQFEDENFYQHNGYSFNNIKKAFLNNMRGGVFTGGSTITQQLVKNIYFRFNKSYVRKVIELFLARHYEKQLSKDEILELYLNIIYYDNGQYGIENACRFYFNKTPSELSWNQAYILASILPIVGIYNPLYHPKDFWRYSKVKLDHQHSKGNIEDEVYDEITRHNAEFIDEEMCSASEFTDQYNKIGPMINERFGPGGKESLLKG